MIDRCSVLEVMQYDMKPLLIRARVYKHLIKGKIVNITGLQVIKK